MNATVALVTSAAAVVAADASTKAAALRLPPNGIGHPSLGLRVVRNRRAGIVGLTPGVATAIVGVVSILLFALAAVADVATTTASGLGLALGGACGNVVDRLGRGAVVDFVVVGRWPVFNLADAALVAGALVAAASVLA